jgi:hypothetical protein
MYRRGLGQLDEEVGFSLTGEDRPVLVASDFDLGDVALPTLAEAGGPDVMRDAGGVSVDLSGFFTGVGNALANFVRGVSVVPTVPASAGRPGTGGCGWNQCPTRQGPVTLCVPCAGAPQAAAALTAQPYFWPLAIGAGALLLIVARGR